MTLIMACCRRGTLAMLGDLMISRESPVADSPELPARFGPNSSVENPYLSGLQQKVFSINDNIAVAWAGNALIARSIIRSIRDRFHAPYTGARILDFIESLGFDDKELASVSFIFSMFVEQPGDHTNVQVQDYNTKEWRNPENSAEFYKFSGSGDYHFFESIGQFNIKPTPGTDPILLAISEVIGRGAIAFYHELTSDDVHNFFYGGSFEVLTTGEAGFVKFPTTILVWSYNDEGVRLIGPIYMQQYNVSGVLGLRRFIQKANGEWEQKLFPVRNFVDDGNVIFSETDCPPTIWTVHYFVQTNSPHEMQMLQATGSDPGFRVWLESGQLRIESKPEFQDRLRSLGVLR